MNVKFAGADDMKSIGFKGEVLDAAEYAKLKADKLSRKPTGYNPFSNNMK